MAEYISREEVLEHSEYTGNFNLVVPVRFIKVMKAADVQLIRHGRWIWGSNAPHREHGAYKCSNCGCHSDFEENYCYNCGARMDLKDGERE